MATNLTYSKLPKKVLKIVNYCLNTFSKVTAWGIKAWVSIKLPQYKHISEELYTEALECWAYQGAITYGDCTEDGDQYYSLQLDATLPAL